MTTLRDRLIRQAREDLYEERAAIMEYDGGMTRAEAERAAMAEYPVLVRQ